MESILFAGSVFFMLWLCYIVYKSDKNKDSDGHLGFFAYKIKKDKPTKGGLKK